ncbi:Lrp/AsnC family transcriptional regulator [Chloroflexota bacterium]
MDDLNNQIVALLQKDGRQSSKALAKQLYVSSATIRRRLRGLLSSGKIRIIAAIEPSQFGYNLEAVVAFDVEHSELNSVTKKLAERPEIRWVATTAGRYDVMAFATLQSPAELSELMQGELTRIKGVKDTETFICLTIKKGQYLTSSD